MKVHVWPSYFCWLFCFPLKLHTNSSRGWWERFAVNLFTCSQKNPKWQKWRKHQNRLPSFLFVHLSFPFDSDPRFLFRVLGWHQACMLDEGRDPLEIFPQTVHLPKSHQYQPVLPHYHLASGRITQKRFTRASPSTLVTFMGLDLLQLYIQPITDVDGTLDCFRFGVSSSANGLVIGATVMEGFYVVFDRAQQRLGFALSSCAGKGTQHGKYSYLLNNTSDFMAEISDFTRQIWINKVANRLINYWVVSSTDNHWWLLCLNTSKCKFVRFSQCHNTLQIHSLNDICSPA